MRGEYFVRFCPTQATVELPPRARRIPIPACYAGVWEGTTSACAENTQRPGGHQRPGGTTSACAENTALFKASSFFFWNYLRVRGEYHHDGKTFLDFLELPPRARRIPVERAQQTVKIGTTSACAENTCHSMRPDSLTRNYLRVRGEYFEQGQTIPEDRELPPRARRIQLHRPGW